MTYIITAAYNKGPLLAYHVKDNKTGATLSCTESDYLTRKVPFTFKCKDTTSEKKSAEKKLLEVCRALNLAASFPHLIDDGYRFRVFSDLKSHKNSKRPMVVGGVNSKAKAVIRKSAAADLDEFVLSEQLEIIKQKIGIWQGQYPADVTFSIDRAKKSRFDYINIVQGLQDMMVRAGIIIDDDADHIIPNFTPYNIRKDNPGCLVFIKNTGTNK